MRNHIVITEGKIAQRESLNFIILMIIVLMIQFHRNVGYVNRMLLNIFCAFSTETTQLELWGIPMES